MNNFKKLFQDKKAQISVEYLLMILFGIILVVISGIVVINLNNLVGVAKTKILNYRDNIISSL
jgi:uncharacterized protein (UPF0333 family)